MKEKKEYLLKNKDIILDEKIQEEIKRKIVTNDEGDEALADFIYDEVIKEPDYKEDYKDYRDD